MVRRGSQLNLKDEREEGVKVGPCLLVHVTQYTIGTRLGQIKRKGTGYLKGGRTSENNDFKAATS